MIEWLILNKIQVLSIVGSLILCAFIFKQIKKRKLKEEYSLLWMGFSILFLLLSIFRPFLEWFAHLVGIFYAPAALLLVLVLAIICVLIQFSMVISSLSEKNKNLVQELGILKNQVENLERQIGSN